KMASSLPCTLALSLAFLLLLPLSSAVDNPPALTYHGGPLLTGNVSLGLIWYGRVGRVQKNVIRSFIKALNANNGANLQPQVSTWWHMVESYQTAASMRNHGIGVKVVTQVTDVTYSAGKILTKDFFRPLIQKATNGNPKMLAVIFTARDVTVDGLCMGKCSLHGVLVNNSANHKSLFVDDQPYIIVGNPETECPGACAWPFHKASFGPQGLTLNPPSGNIGADAMVVAFAGGLAETVTNPFNTGFYQGAFKPVEAASACAEMFGTTAAPGSTGKVLIDPKNGGGFNAHGLKGKKFLLPALWNPQTQSCWTLM
ncbi:Phi_1 domain-containing protein, partial [Cephalotus follicularis]